MPSKGFKTITIEEKVYNKEHELFEEKKSKGLLPPGINNFTSYIVYEMETNLQEKELLNNLANKITTLPERFSTTKLVIDPSISTPQQISTIALHPNILL